jgi:acyl-CoA hydrolase/RimJ/RimL family protein N-acetyltransferase
MDLRKHCPQKIVTAAQAVSMIKNGSRVFIGSGCGEPQHLIHAMAADINIQDVMIFQMLAFTLGDYLRKDDFLRRFALKLFFVTVPMRKATFQGRIDYIPAYLSEIPDLFKSGQIGIDAVLIQISPPDRFGLASLGVSVDVTREAVRNSKLVIAQVNPQMPRTHGDSFIHIDDIDYLVPHSEKLVEHVPEGADEEITQRIAYYVSELIDDGSTIQAGYGQMPYALLKYLDTKNDLGVHTHMITDTFIPLYEKGVITNKRKSFLTDRTVATFCMGTKISYDYIDNNPRFYFGTADFVNNPRNIGLNDNLVSISSALEVDLTGQVCADSVGRQFFSGTGDQANFIRGAALSKGGLSIIALPSTAKNGKVSRIVPTLAAGAGLATLRADVNFVVTEYGIAQLRGKSVYQRVIELTQIAHPDFRAELVGAAKHHHYIFVDQLPPPAVDLIFIEDYKSTARLKNGRTITVRPLLPSDEIAYRNFFYSLQQETIFFRFFRNIKVFSHKMAQAHWATLDYRKNVSLVGLVRKKGHQEIVAIGTYAGVDQTQAEVAFVVREDFQGMGIATYLLSELQRAAAKSGFRSFFASILPKNTTMKHIFRKAYPDARIEAKSDEIKIWMDF